MDDASKTLRSNVDYQWEGGVVTQRRHDGGAVLTRRGNQWVTRDGGMSIHKQSHMPAPQGPGSLRFRPVGAAPQPFWAQPVPPSSKKKARKMPRFVKGSPEARAHMAALRAQQGGGSGRRKKASSRRPAAVMAVPARHTAWTGRDRAAHSMGSRNLAGQFGFRAGPPPVMPVHAPAPARAAKKARKKAAKKASRRAVPASVRPAKKARKKAAKKAARRRVASVRPAKKARKKAARRVARPVSVRPVSSRSAPHMGTKEFFKRIGIR